MVQVDFQRKASKLAVPLGKSYLRLKQQSNQQCNELLDCDILNFHTSLLQSVDVELPKTEKGRGLELCLKSADELWMNTASALATLPLLANTECLGYFHDLSATCCQGLQTSCLGLFEGLVLAIFWFFFFSWLVGGDFFVVLFGWVFLTGQYRKNLARQCWLYLWKQDMDLPPTAYLKNQKFQRKHPKSMALVYTVLFPQALHFKQVG